MNWLDFVFFVIVISSVGSGIAMGFARVGVGMAATVLGFVFSSWFYDEAGGVLAPYMSSRWLANLLGFIFIFVAVLVLGAMLGKIMATFFKWVGLSWLDRLLGAALGVVRGIVICSILMMGLVGFSPQPPPKVIVHSQFAPYLIESSNVIAGMTPPELKDAFRRSYQEAKKQWVEILRKEREHRPLERDSG